MSAKIDTGGYIIPTPCPSATDGREFDGGLTVRDWFAGQATQSDIDDYTPATVGDLANFERTEGFKWSRAWAKYRYADAMLAARKERAT